jgi:hypothetical protein
VIKNADQANIVREWARRLRAIRNGLPRIVPDGPLLELLQHAYQHDIDLLEIDVRAWEETLSQGVDQDGGE